MIGGFFSGVRMLVRGFGFWARRPSVMLLGLIPAAIVFLLVAGALVALGFGLPGITDWLTPRATSAPATSRNTMAAGISPSSMTPGRRAQKPKPRTSIRTPEKKPPITRPA